MSLPVILRPDAEGDLVEIIDDLDYVRPGLGKRFAGRLREALERIEWMPESCGIVWQDVRATRVKKFRYIVYYVVLAETVDVLAILHSSRDESALRSRA